MKKSILKTLAVIYLIYIMISLLTLMQNTYAADLKLNAQQCMQLYNYQKFLEYARDNGIKKTDIVNKIINDFEITNKAFLIKEADLIYNLPKNSKYAKGTLRQCEKGGIVFREV